MNKAILLGVLSLIFLMACTPSTPTSCTTNDDCKSVFNRCSCSYVCLNEVTNLNDVQFDPDYGLVMDCPDRSCPGDRNPELIPEKPVCGCVPLTQPGRVTGSREVVNDCRIIS